MTRKEMIKDLTNKFPILLKYKLRIIFVTGFDVIIITPENDSEQATPFSHYNRASKYAKDHGYSVGIMQSSSPIALKKGDFAVPKWRNLNTEERWNIEGLLLSKSFRNSEVFLVEFSALGEK